MGLAHALAAAKRGLKVVVFERNLYAVGASIRNFGMIWPVGQPAGILYERALRAREIWTEVAPQAGIALDPCGSLHLAYRADEMDVLQEFVETQGRDSVRLLDAAEAAEKSPAVVTKGLLGALWSATEMTVDPREAIRKLPAFLAEVYGVKFCFGQVMTAIAPLTSPQAKPNGRQITSWSVAALILKRCIPRSMQPAASPKSSFR